MTLEYQPERWGQRQELEKIYQEQYNKYIQSGSDYAAHGMAATFIYNLIKEQKEKNNGNQVGK